MLDDLVASNLIYLTLEVADDLGGDVVAEDLEEVDLLVTGDGFVSDKLDALLNFVDGGVFWDEQRVLGLSYGFAAEHLTVFLLWESRNHRDHQGQESHSEQFHLELAN